MLLVLKTNKFIAAASVPSSERLKDFCSTLTTWLRFGWFEWKKINKLNGFLLLIFPVRSLFIYAHTCGHVDMWLFSYQSRYISLEWILEYGRWKPSIWTDTLQYVINRFLFWFHFICYENRRKTKPQQHYIHMLSLLDVCTICTMAYAYSSRPTRYWNNIRQHLQRIMPTASPVKP